MIYLKKKKKKEIELIKVVYTCSSQKIGVGEQPPIDIGISIPVLSVNYIQKTQSQLGQKKFLRCFHMKVEPSERN